MEASKAQAIPVLQRLDNWGYVALLDLASVLLEAAPALTAPRGLPAATAGVRGEFPLALEEQPPVESVTLRSRPERFPAGIQARRIDPSTRPDKDEVPIRTAGRGLGAGRTRRIPRAGRPDGVIGPGGRRIL